MDTKTLQTVTYVMLFVGISFVAGVAVAHKSIHDNYTPQYKEFDYLCNPFTPEYYFNCPKELQFQNISGLYCNGTMVCQNTPNAGYTDKTEEQK